MDERIAGILACPRCRGPVSLNVTHRDRIGILEGSVICEACVEHYKITDGVFDLRPGVRVWDEEGKPRWDLDKCEQGYDSIGLYKSSRDWAQIRGVPVEVVDFIHRYVKGQLLDWAQFSASESVVDVGCGVGHFLFDLRARKSAPDMIFAGMDVALPRVLAMRKRCEQENAANVLCIAGDSESLPFAANSIDNATCSEVLEHVFHPDRAVAEMCRILKPSGMLLISTPSGTAARNWEYLVKPVRWARNVFAGSVKQGSDPGYDVPIDLGRMRKYLGDNQLEVMNFAIQPVLPCEHFFKQIPSSMARIIVSAFRWVNRCSPFLGRQLGLHAVIRCRKDPSMATVSAR